MRNSIGFTENIYPSHPLYVHFFVHHVSCWKTFHSRISQFMVNCRLFLLHFPGWWFQSLWNIWKSVGMMTFPIYGKSFKIPWFQTTNQILHLTLYSWFTLFHIMVDLSIIYQFTRGYINSCQHWFINIKIWKSVGVIIPNIRNSLGKTHR